MVVANDGNDSHQIYTVLTVCLNAVVTGQLLAWPSPSIPQLTSSSNPNKMTMEEVSYVTIIPSIASICAAPFVGTLIDLIGRKYSLLSVTISYTLAWILVAIGDPSIYLLYTSRILVGIGDVCMFTTIPCYVSEVTTPRVRGSWGNCVSLTVYLGQFLANVIGSYFTIQVTAFISLSMPAIFFLNFYFLRESPYYLIMKNREESGRKALQWLRKREDVEDELLQLSKDVKRQLSERGRFKDLFLIGSNRRALVIGVVMRIGQQYSGIAAFAMYAQTIFINSGTDLSASTSAMLFSGFLFIISALAARLLDIMGRRVAMLSSTCACCCVLFLQAAFYYVKDVAQIKLDGFDLFPLISMITFVFGFSLGLGVVPTLMLGELFSGSIKSKAFVISNMFFFIAVATSTYIFSNLVESYGLWAAFLFFSICCFVNLVVSYFLVPETKGRTLEQIQQDLKKLKSI